MSVPGPHRYFVDVTLDTGEHLQSRDFIGDVFGDVFATETSAAADPEIQHLRQRPMVEAVAVIRCATGEVLVDLPGFAVLARARPARDDGQQLRLL